MKNEIKKLNLRSFIIFTQLMRLIDLKIFDDFLTQHLI